MWYAGEDGGKRMRLQAVHLAHDVDVSNIHKINLRFIVLGSVLKTLHLRLRE